MYSIERTRLLSRKKNQGYSLSIIDRVTSQRIQRDPDTLS